MTFGGSSAPAKGDEDVVAEEVGMIVMASAVAVSRSSRSSRSSWSRELGFGPATASRCVSARFVPVMHSGTGTRHAEEPGLSRWPRDWLGGGTLVIPVGRLLTSSGQIAHFEATFGSAFDLLVVASARVPLQRSDLFETGSSGSMRVLSQWRVPRDP